MSEETRNPLYDGQYEGESASQAAARREWARVGMQLAREIVAYGGAERCDTCGTVTVRLDGDGCAKWCCKCGAKLTGNYVNVPAEAYPHGSPLHKEVFLALSSYNGSDTFEDGVRALIAELKAVRADGAKDRERLKFILAARRELAKERLPSSGAGDKIAVYVVEEMSTGTRQYPASTFVGNWVGDPVGRLAHSLTAIDLAIAQVKSEQTGESNGG